VTEADFLTKLVAKRAALLLQSGEGALFLFIAAKDGDKYFGGGEVRRDLDAPDGDKARKRVAQAADQPFAQDFLDFFGDAGGSNGHADVKAGEV
jgi:hypothetical protein